VPNTVPEDVAKFIKIWNSASGQYIDGSEIVDTRHEMLDVDAYIHITSPIRRLVDLMNMIKIQKIKGIIQLSAKSSDFYDKWLQDIDYINATMRSIRKVQCDCSLLDLCHNNPETMEKEYKKIVDLERMYFDKIWDIMSSPDFIKDLREVSEFIQNNYKQLSDFWGEKNKVKIAVERLIRFHSYKELNVIGIYPSPLSSDMAIVTEDCVINIDAKTIDMNGNAGDDTSIHFQKNQITFDNIPFFEQNIEGLKYLTTARFGLLGKK
jgi:hypothetical protein